MLQGKPSYAPEDCPVCKERKLGKCGRCGIVMPEYSNMGRNGYQSPSPTHWHHSRIGGVPGFMAIFAQLCLECYRAEYALKYPNEVVPV